MLTCLRLQISRLYRPIAVSTDSLPYSDSDDEMSGTMLLPMYNDRSGHEASAGKPQKDVRDLLNNVWDEREDVFGIGDSDEDDEDFVTGKRSRSPSPLPTTPKIVVTSS